MARYAAFELDKRAARRSYGVLSSYVPELIAVRFGMRTSFQLTLSHARQDHELPRIERFCQRAGLRIKVERKRAGSKIAISSEPLCTHPAVQSAMDAGFSFSYPPCCTTAFQRRGSDNYFANRLSELFPESGRVYDFRLNPFMVTTPFHLFKHFPCSMPCAQTLSSASRLLELIESQNPDLAQKIARYNRTPVLFTDVCGSGVSFIGKLVEQRRIEYSHFFSDIGPRRHLARAPRNTSSDIDLHEGLLAALGEGSAVSLIDPRRIRVEDRQHPIAEFARPPHLTWVFIDFQ